MYGMIKQSLSVFAAEVAYDLLHVKPQLQISPSITTSLLQQFSVRAIVGVNVYSRVCAADSIIVHNSKKKPAQHCWKEYRL